VRIAVGGCLVRSWDRIAPRLESALRAGPPFPPELVVGRFPYDAPLLGAVALAIDSATKGVATSGAGTSGAGVTTVTSADGAGITEIAETAITDVTGVTNLTLNSNTGV
jgi:hypothetical protein